MVKQDVLMEETKELVELFHFVGVPDQRITDMLTKYIKKYKDPKFSGKYIYSCGSSCPGSFPRMWTDFRSWAFNNLNIKP